MMSEIDLRTNCPFCLIDINLPEHNPENCLHESYNMLIQARERMDTLENRLNNVENRNEGTPAPAEEAPPPNRTIQRLRRLKWRLYDFLNGWLINILFSAALLRFIIYGLG